MYVVGCYVLVVQSLVCPRVCGLIPQLTQKTEAVCALPLAFHLHHEDPRSCSQDATSLAYSANLTIFVQVVLPYADSDTTACDTLEACLGQCDVKQYLAMFLASE